jgi:hypothetical protein
VPAWKSRLLATLIGGNHSNGEHQLLLAAELLHCIAVVFCCGTGTENYRSE